MPFIKLLPITHGLLILSIVLMISALIKEIKSNNSMMAKGFLLALSVLGFFSSFSLIEFYTKPLTSDRIWFMLGFITFILILVYFCVKRVWQLYEQNTKLKFYHDMAYADMMTLAQNRTAFNEMMGQLRGTDLTDVTLLILDINNLKQVNDQYGHQRDDQMIIDTSTCILSVFKNNVYRIGGDEFAVLVLDDDVMVQDYLKRLDDTLSNYNTLHQYPISLAYGYAKGKSEMDIEALFKQADENMYAKKFKQKSEL